MRSKVSSLLNERRDRFANSTSTHNPPPPSPHLHSSAPRNERLYPYVATISSLHALPLFSSLLTFPPSSHRRRCHPVDFGSQYSHLIARRVRESKVYCELNACTMTAEDLAAKIDDINVKCIILSGGPSSVYEEGAPHLSEGMWELFASKGLPVLGICYGLQEMANHFGAEVASSDHREFGHASLTVSADAGEAGALFADVSDLQVWMSHGDKLISLPEGFSPVAATPSCEFAAIANPTAKMCVD